MSMMYGGPRKAFAVRFEPGTDLVPAMQEAAHQAMTMSGSLSSSSCLSQSTMILSAVGSMSQATVRMASAHRNDILNTHDFRTWYKPMEIVSLVGTFAVPAVDMVQGGALLSPPSPSYGPFHLQMSFSDDNGHVYGGHVVSGTVSTTLELVLGVIMNVRFVRQINSVTGYRELNIQPILSPCHWNNHDEDDDSDSTMAAHGFSPNSKDITRHEFVSNIHLFRFHRFLDRLLIYVILGSF